MKELSIEEKAKRYDEAIERAKVYKGLQAEMEFIFPELKESEDEKIRKALIKSFNEYLKQSEAAWSKEIKFKYVNVKDAIAWLEKQGEQKSNFKIGNIIKRPNSKVTYRVTNIDDYGFQLDGEHWFKHDRKPEFELVEQKPWSEEDERNIKVQKIREKVEKLKSNLIYGACSSQVAMETRCKEEAYNEVLAILDKEIIAKLKDM